MCLPMMPAGPAQRRDKADLDVVGGLRRQAQQHRGGDSDQMLSSFPFVRRSGELFAVAEAIALPERGGSRKKGRQGPGAAA